MIVRIVGAVRVTMVFLVHVRVGVNDRLMRMAMLMVLRDVQPYPQSHQEARACELQCHRLAERLGVRASRCSHVGAGRATPTWRSATTNVRLTP